MRQRTKVREFWRVRWEHYDGRTGVDAYDDRDSALQYLAALRGRRNYVARLYRVTVYRGAKLREVDAWRRDSTLHRGTSAGTEGGAGACVEDCGRNAWEARAWSDDVVVTSRGHRTKADAMRAAEDALAWLGYRVKKGER